jgi:hypothetical protein
MSHLNDPVHAPHAVLLGRRAVAPGGTSHDDDEDNSSSNNNNNNMRPKYKEKATVNSNRNRSNNISNRNNHGNKGVTRKCVVHSRSELSISTNACHWRTSG